MRLDFKYIILSIIILLIQSIIDSYLVFGNYLTIFIYPTLILALCRYKNSKSILIYAFIVGLSADLLTNGTLGLNALASTVMAGAAIILAKTANSKRKIYTSIIISVAIFQLTYYIFEGISINDYLFFIIRFTLSLMVNSIIAIVISRSISKK